MIFFEDDDPGTLNPYVAGALAGVLLVLTAVFAGHYLGASTSFVRAAGLIEEGLWPEHAAATPHFAALGLHLDWQMFFLAGIFLGALLASLTTGSFRIQAVPESFRERFGPGLGRRALLGFLGGMLAMFGARLAGGCPSGHGLSGVAQLSLAGFLSLACFFLGGLVAARLVYGGRRRPWME